MPPQSTSNNESVNQTYALRKFTLHPTATTSPTSPLTLCLANSTPLSLANLSALRSTLIASRTLAAERLGICDLNRKNLIERQAIDKRALDEGAKLKELERKRKREDDEKKDRERTDKIERDRLEKEREEMLTKRKEQEVYEQVKLKEEEDKRIADELERAEAVRKAIEEKEKKKVEQVLELVRVNEAERVDAPSINAVSPDGTESPAPEDVSMADISTTDLDSISKDVPSIEISSDSISIPLSTSLDSSDVKPIVDSKMNGVIIASSPDLEDESGQPKPPSRKSLDKKKRKRDQVLDSEGSESEAEGNQPLLQKIRKIDEGTFSTNNNSASPAPPSLSTSQLPPKTPTVTITEPKPIPVDPFAGLSNVQRKLKDEKFIKHSIPTRAPVSGTATAFYLPYHSVVPVKPVSIPPIPTPKKQSEVAEDFSKAKPGTQIAHHTFYTWAEAYLRPFGEDDLAFLAPKPDDVSPYLIPPLGKHYLDRWEEDDSDVPIASTSYISPLEPPPLIRTRPDALTEDALGMENVYLGPLSERLLAALAFEEKGQEGDLEEEETRMLKALGGETPSRAGKMVGMDALDLEERIKRELRFIGILPDEDVDWSAREDDEISSALRACQRLLHNQSSLNEARKGVLSSLVQDRMAYQDYETTRDAQERVIESGWTKRQRAGKKKGKGKEKEKLDGPKPPVSLALLGAIDKRSKLVKDFKPFFEDEEDKGRFFGIPETSIYEGMEVPDDVEVDQGSSTISSSKVL